MTGEQLSLPFPRPASGPPITRPIAVPPVSVCDEAAARPDTAEPAGLARRALDPRLRPSRRRRRRRDEIRNGVLAEVIPIESEVRQRAGATHGPATGDLPPCA